MSARARRALRGGGRGRLPSESGSGTSRGPTRVALPRCPGPTEIARAAPRRAPSPQPEASWPVMVSNGVTGDDPARRPGIFDRRSPMKHDRSRAKLTRRRDIETGLPTDFRVRLGPDQCQGRVACCSDNQSPGGHQVEADPDPWHRRSGAPNGVGTLVIYRKGATCEVGWIDLISECLCVPNCRLSH
jgi:hypothetical protein